MISSDLKKYFCDLSDNIDKYYKTIFTRFKNCLDNTTIGIPINQFDLSEFEIDFVNNFIYFYLVFKVKPGNVQAGQLVYLWVHPEKFTVKIC